MGGEASPFPANRVFGRGVKFLLIIGYKMLSGPQIGAAGRRHTYRLEMDTPRGGNDAMNDPYGSKVRRLKQAVLSEPGTLDPAVRQAVCRAADLPDALGPYVQKVVRHAYKVTSEDITALHQAGYSDDQIFEVTVSAALGAGLVRLDSGLSALRENSVITSIGMPEGL
jgi:hypothetical protein